MGRAVTVSRIDTLLGFLEEDPADSFSRYALAMEYAKLERYADAVAEYQTLVANDPEYVATYYQIGKLFERLGRSDDAREAYRSGIAVAGRKGDGHTRDELTEALSALG
jgi:tetratricopeptide (TPR) repeat protein